MNEQKIVLQQLQRKMDGFREAGNLVRPESGWIHSIRKALNMSMRQLGNRLGISPQSVRDMELRERSMGLTLKVLSQVAESLDMKLVYGIIPKEGSLEQIIEIRARELAGEIVKRTSTSMGLENQQVSEEQENYNLDATAEKLVREMPRYLWD